MFLQGRNIVYCPTRIYFNHSPERKILKLLRKKYKWRMRFYHISKFSLFFLRPHPPIFFSGSFILSGQNETNCSLEASKENLYNIPFRKTSMYSLLPSLLRTSSMSNFLWNNFILALDGLRSSNTIDTDNEIHLIKLLLTSFSVESVVWGLRCEVTKVSKILCVLIQFWGRWKLHTQLQVRPDHGIWKTKQRQTNRKGTTEEKRFQLHSGTTPCFTVRDPPPRIIV